MSDENNFHIHDSDISTTISAKSGKPFTSFAPTQKEMEAAKHYNDLLRQRDERIAALEAALREIREIVNAILNEEQA
jgi:hypothetical protein